MSRWTVAAQTIKDSVTAVDVGNVLGLEIRHGRCRCPLHGGSDFNCVLYKGDRGFYCHVCKRGGDVIKFVEEYCDLSFKDALAWFDEAFRMGLDLGGAVDPEKQKAAEKALLRRKNAKEFAEWRQGMFFDLALVAEQIERKLEESRDTHRPKTYGNWDGEFYTAVRLIPEARLLADDCLMECTKG